MSKRTRQRHLQRLAERRAAERRRRRRQRVIAGVVAGAVAAGGIGVAAVAFLGDGEQSSGPRAGSSATPSPRSESPTPGAGESCDPREPKSAKEEKPMFDEPPKVQIDPSNEYRATMKTSCGTVRLELFAEETPVTVNSFVFLAREGFFDGLTFHRIIPGFMAQGGDPQGDGTGGPGYQFEDEIVDDLTFDKPGLLAMANSGPDTNGSQFFITTGEPTHLNGAHTIFGRVTGGMDAVRAIEALGSPEGAPVEPVYIEKVTIEED